MKFPNFFELSGLFENHGLLMKFLQSHNHIASSSVCCNVQSSLKPHKNSDGVIWKCNVCKATRSVRKGSIYSNAKISLAKCILLIYLWVLKIPFFAVVLLSGLSRPTVSSWLFWIDNVTSKYLSCQTLKLGGPGKIVEVDESYWFKSKYNRGRQKRTYSWVFVIVERGVDGFRSKFVCFFVKRRTRKVLEHIISKFVIPGSTIISDEFKSYHNLSQLGFTHHTVSFKSISTFLKRP
jgi:hypothetical protein